LEQGADSHVTNAHGKTPMHLAERLLDEAKKNLKEAKMVSILKGE
jgi:hypothetical protein